MDLTLARRGRHDVPADSNRPKERVAVVLPFSLRLLKFTATRKSSSVFMRFYTEDVLLNDVAIERNRGLLGAKCACIGVPRRQRERAPTNSHQADGFDINFGTSRIRLEKTNIQVV